MARSLYHYRYFDLREVPVAHRHQSLMRQIRQWSPFDEYDTYVVWRKQAAWVWMWDKTRLHTAQQTQAIHTLHILPETLLHPTLQEGAQCVACLEGVEGQLWREHQLVASRWWPQMPCVTEWHIFLRANQFSPETGLPAVVEGDLAARPWAKSAKMDHSALLRDERLWVYVGIMLFVVLWIGEGVPIWELRKGIAQLEQETQQVSEQAVPILTARNQALQTQQQIETLRGLIRYPSQLEIMAKAAGVMPTGAIFESWAYQNGRLQFTVRGQSLDPAAAIRQFQEQALFEDIRAESGRDAEALRLSMRVKGLP
ncbi:hypothetical protein [Thioflexithrix psekupsensis]|uniref:Uncharacterized protein n=1 Tax=Thioflexithrix psekupsensis TaxID=1570016 RepID=A0A251X947_9GAMM|nr:hypothetical protein [Thioflexithrix psekupsensis]OUD14314.1 hypothetical protein TPSD3_08300 [Thioflexithrix psekupsensis]